MEVFYKEDLHCKNEPGSAGFSIEEDFGRYLQWRGYVLFSSENDIDGVVLFIKENCNLKDLNDRRGFSIEHFCAEPNGDFSIEDVLYEKKMDEEDFDYEEDSDFCNQEDRISFGIFEISLKEKTWNGLFHQWRRLVLEEWRFRESKEFRGWRGDGQRRIIWRRGPWSRRLFTNTPKCCKFGIFFDAAFTG